MVFFIKFRKVQLGFINVYMIEIRFIIKEYINCLH